MKQTKMGELQILFDSTPIAYLCEMADGQAIYDKGRMMAASTERLH